jgi:hypothetical protein
VDKTYFQALTDPMLGFAGITAQTILAHLLTAYGTITTADLEANRERLKSAWNVETPIEGLWERIRECQRIATAGQEPISDRTTIRLLLPVLEATGVLTTWTQQQRQLPEAQWTMVQFKALFKYATKEYKKCQLTAQSVGYHGANAARPASPVSHPVTPLVLPPNSQGSIIY